LAQGQRAQDRSERADFLFDKQLGIVYNTIMKRCQIVIDTNVLVAALRSKRGASYKLFMLISSGKFTIHISVPLILEYEDVAKRLLKDIPLTEQDIDDILDYLCAIAQQQQVFYLWRPIN